MGIDDYLREKIILSTINSDEEPLSMQELKIYQKAINKKIQEKLKQKAILNFSETKNVNTLNTGKAGIR